MKVLRPVLTIAALVVAYKIGGPALAAALGIGTGAATAVAVTVALAASSTLYQRRPKLETQGISGRISMSDQTPQWIAVGETALPAEMIYWGTSGGENKELSIILTHACHPIHGFTGLKINGIDTSYPTPTGPYAGILSIQTTDGTHTTNPFTDVQGGWDGPGRDLAMSHFRWTYNEEKLRSGLPQNIQFTCKGIKVYDPRRDSTRGGTGSMRADDESTWAYEVGGVQLGNNPALVDLTYLLGWKKNGLLWAGQGVDPANIDMASYIAGANVCDEIIGGSRRRYTINGVITLSEFHNTNRSRILSCCAGRPIDAGGLLGLWVAHDDTAVASMAFQAADIVADISWEPLPDSQTRNTARGSFLDPVNGWTAQPYMEVRPTDLIALDNGIELVDQIDFPMVTNADQARALASIRLRESRQGVYVAPMRLKALGVTPTQVISQTLAQQAWTAKKFRVESMVLDGETVQVRARAVQASDYALPGAASLAPVTLPDTLGFAPALDSTRDTLPILPQGNWAAGIDYTKGQIVQYLANTYTAAADHTSATGNRPPSSSWELLAPSGDNAVSVAANFTTASTSYTTPATPEAECRAGPGGVVTISAPLRAMADPSNSGSYTVFAKWQRDIAGVWTDVATETGSSTLAPGDEQSPFSVNATVSGLTAGTLYKFRLMMRRGGAGPGSDVVTLDGIANLAGS